MDSLEVTAYEQWVKDSLTVEAWSDSMKVGVERKFHVDTLKLKNKLDSLSSLKLPTEAIQSKLDSIKAKKEELVASITATHKEILERTEKTILSWKENINHKVDSLHATKVKSKFDSLNSKKEKLVEGINQTQVELKQRAEEKISSWKRKIQARDSLGVAQHIPGTSLPDVDKVELSSLGVPGIPSLSSVDFSELNLSPDLSQINAALPFVSLDGLISVQESIKEIKGTVSQIKMLKANPKQIVETAVTSLKGLAEVKQLEELTGPMKQLPTGNPADAKAKLTQMSVNHFAGKEQALSGAITSVLKYKQKYSSTQSLKDIPKKKPNELKDKPFIERFLPGLMFQFQQQIDYKLDIYAYGSYRVTDKILTGLGWNHRVARDEDNSYWNHKAIIFGPRVFANYNLGRGFIGHIEFELMNTNVAPPLTDPVVGKREWVWGTMTGVKKEYKITRNLRGTFLVLYNIYDPNHKSPHTDRLNTRFGFEYKLKRKSKNIKDTNSSATPNKSRKTLKNYFKNYGKQDEYL
jgi:hypothetical protein